jgi:hypothetical protein
MAGIDPQEQTLEQLEAHVAAMEWQQVSLDPDAALWKEIEQDLPAEWTQLELREEYSQEELAAFLDAEIDVPPGDIDRNAQEALQSFDIDLEAIIQERDTELDVDREPEHDFDFDR